MLYHHCIDLENIVYGEIEADPKHSGVIDDPEFNNAYTWLEKEIGFWPLFLAVGATDEDIRMTGYQDNWVVKESCFFKNGKPGGDYRKAGEFPNKVLFSYNHIEGIFMDYGMWEERVLCMGPNNNYELTDYDKRLIFKYSWSRAKWLRDVKKWPHSLQIVVPKLNLADADRIWVRNRKTKKSLESKGFNKIEVKRILIDRLF